MSYKILRYDEIVVGDIYCINIEHVYKLIANRHPDRVFKRIPPVMYVVIAGEVIDDYIPVLPVLFYDDSDDQMILTNDILKATTIIPNMSVKFINIDIVLRNNNIDLQSDGLMTYIVQTRDKDTLKYIWLPYQVLASGKRIDISNTSIYVKDVDPAEPLDKGITEPEVIWYLNDAVMVLHAASAHDMLLFDVADTHRFMVGSMSGASYGMVSNYNVYTGDTTIPTGRLSLYSITPTVISEVV